MSPARPRTPGATPSTPGTSQNETADPEFLARVAGAAEAAGVAGDVLALFSLAGDDDPTLTARAKRLAEITGTSPRDPKHGNVSPREGTTLYTVHAIQPDGSVRTFTEHDRPPQAQSDDVTRFLDRLFGPFSDD